MMRMGVNCISERGPTTSKSNAYLDRMRRTKSKFDVPVPLFWALTESPRNFVLVPTVPFT